MLQFSGFTIDFFNLRNSVKTLAVTKSAGIFFWKTNNEKQMHGKKFCTEVIIHWT